MELTGRNQCHAAAVAAGRRTKVVDTPAAAGRDCGAYGGRQLIAEPLDSIKKVERARNDHTSVHAEARKAGDPHAGRRKPATYEQAR